MVNRGFAQLMWLVMVFRWFSNKGPEEIRDARPTFWVVKKPLRRPESWRNVGRCLLVELENYILYYIDMIYINYMILIIYTFILVVNTIGKYYW